MKKTLIIANMLFVSSAVFGMDLNPENNSQQANISVNMNVVATEDGNLVAELNKTEENTSELGKLNEIKAQIENGADINAKNEDGDTFLLIACKSGDIESVKYLLENDADATITNKDGKTPLEVALDFGQEAVANYLIELNAEDVNIENVDDATSSNIAETEEMENLQNEQATGEK